MNKQVTVEVSARHVHLSQNDLLSLFGTDYQLTKKKELSQPGQFACEERVSIIGPKNTIEKVSILGPIRPFTQVEVSLSDARILGIEALIRESGDITGTNGCVLQGPVGEIVLDAGLIAAKRHLHVSEKGAEELGVKEKEIIGIKLESADRSCVLYDVVVRVSEKFATAVHIDTDEANAAAFSGGMAEIIK